MADPTSMIERCLREPEHLLGVIERNVEAKVVTPVLELLGWDLVGQVLWGPQLRRTVGTRSRVVEADVIVADVADQRLRFVVEVKRWGRPLGKKAIDQTLQYLADLAAERALLTNGRHWFVLDALQDQPLARLRLDKGSSRDHIANLITELASFLSPASAPSCALPLVVHRTSAELDLHDVAAADVTVAALVNGITAVVEEHLELVYIDAGPKGMLIRAQETGRAILPINAADPLRLELYSKELIKLNVDPLRIESFRSAISRLSLARSPEAVAEVIKAFDELVLDMNNSHSALRGPSTTD